ncbi:MAG: hypothetical protein IPK28_02810 [Devosia sp.]|nr:hypothetical protein [Devosia sp.]
MRDCSLALVARLLALRCAALLCAGASAQAAESCTSWSTEMMDDEGGPVLTTWACAPERSDVLLLLNCTSGTVWMRYDLATEEDGSAELDETVSVRFATEQGTQTLPMVFEEMDARHAGDFPVDAPLVDLLRSGRSLEIGDVDGRYPARTFSLQGPKAAIDALLAACEAN